MSLKDPFEDKEWKILEDDWEDELIFRPTRDERNKWEEVDVDDDDDDSQDNDDWLDDDSEDDEDWSDLEDDEDWEEVDDDEDDDFDE